MTIAIGCKTLSLYLSIYHLSLSTIYLFGYHLSVCLFICVMIYLLSVSVCYLYIYYLISVYLLSVCLSIIYLFAANYLGTWKCISVLKGDGTPGEGHTTVAQNTISSTPASNGNASGNSSGIVRYKGKTVTGTSQVVWH